MPSATTGGRPRCASSDPGRPDRRARPSPGLPPGRADRRGFGSASRFARRAIARADGPPRRPRSATPEHHQAQRRRARSALSWGRFRPSVAEDAARRAWMRLSWSGGAGRPWVASSSRSLRRLARPSSSQATAAPDAASSSPSSPSPACTRSAAPRCRVSASALGEILDGALEGGDAILRRGGRLGRRVAPAGAELADVGQGGVEAQEVLVQIPRPAPVLADRFCGRHVGGAGQFRETVAVEPLGGGMHEGGGAGVGEEIPALLPVALGRGSPGHRDGACPVFVDVRLVGPADARPGPRGTRSAPPWPPDRGHGPARSGPARAPGPGTRRGSSARRR